MRQQVISGIRPGFPGLSQSQGQVTHVLLTRSPLEYPPKEAFPLDLHVLSTPPAFVLSQDQTLHQGTTTTPTPHQQAREPRAVKPSQKTSWQTPTPKGRRIASKKSPPPPPHGGHGHGASNPHARGRTIKALAFNTLLSSQETDTHRTRTAFATPVPGRHFLLYRIRSFCQFRASPMRLPASACAVPFWRYRYFTRPGPIRKIEPFPMPSDRGRDRATPT
jgi:hypothetical protein